MGDQRAAGGDDAVYAAGGAAGRPVRAAAGESLSRAFLELARHRLPGSTFDSLLQEALAACGPGSDNDDKGLQRDAHLLQVIQGGEGVEPRPESLPVVITPDADFEAETH